MSNPEILRSPRNARVARGAQRGVSLVELLVGMLISLMVIGAAMGTLIMSRSAAGSVTDISQLQQQGSYALRVIARQVRQAGSLHLVPTVGLDTFSFDSTFTGVLNSGNATKGINGANGDLDQVSFSNETSGTLLKTQAADCLGNTPNLPGHRMDSTFYVSNGELFCRGANTTQPAQALISNVADFQVWYRVKTSAETIQRLNAAEVDAAALWALVRSVEICLELQGTESNNPDVGTYIRCNGDAASRGGRQHLVFTNVYDLRTQGG